MINVVSSMDGGFTPWGKKLKLSVMQVKVEIFNMAMSGMGPWPESSRSPKHLTIGQPIRTKLA